MIIYLSGPISGNPTYLDDFAVAANWLASAGHSPVNPCDISQDHWGKCRPGYDPGEGGDHTSACFMTKDLLALLDADAIMMLDGWESSRGARTELAVARAIGLRVLNPDLTPHRLDGPVAVGESIDGAVPRPVMDAVAELTRQHQKWGEQNHADGTGPVTRPLRRLAVNLYLRSAVELANAAKKRCDAEHAAGHGKWDSILLEEVFEAFAEDDPKLLRAELVQVAAVALQWADAIDRRTMGATK